MADNDSQIDLKKRARRRLVGSAALALAAVIILPMVMDHEPRQTVPDVQIRIPSQEGGNFFTSRVITGKAPAPSQPVAGTVAEETVAPEVDDGAHHKEDGDLPPPLLKPGQELLPPSRLKKADLAKPDPRPEPPKKTEIKSEPLKKPESKPESPKKAETKPDVKKPEAKLEAKSDPKQKEREREKEKEKAEADKARADAERAKALLTGAAPKEPSGGAHVVMLGAYRESANVTSLRAKLKAEGYASYVEPLGDKIRVRAGPFPNKAAADKAAARISKILGVQASVASKP